MLGLSRFHNAVVPSWTVSRAGKTSSPLSRCVETGLLMLPIGGDGMSLYEAWCHTAGTLATGGFSTRNSSVAAFNSAYIEWVIIVFMFLAGTNFVLHLRALTGKPLAFWKDEEFRFYFFVVLFSVITISIGLTMISHYDSILTTLRHSAFSVVAIMTTTGFCTEDFDLWPIYAKVLLVCLMFVGGCGGSTGGGMKVSRVLLLIKHGLVQLQRNLYPRSVTNVRLDNNRVSEMIMSRVLGFLFIYVAIFIVLTLMVCVVEPDLIKSHEPHEADVHAIERRGVETAATSVAATLCNIGPGLAKVGPTQNFAWFAPITKILLSFAMLIGRLEVFTVLVLFLPSFWRR